jgi:hypothetical protein
VNVSATRFVPCKASFEKQAAVRKESRIAYVGDFELGKFAFHLAMGDGQEAADAAGIPCSITISAMRILSFSKHGRAPEGGFPDIILQIFRTSFYKLT